MSYWNLNWSKTEKTIARAAFDKAYNKECSAILESLRKKVLTCTGPDDIWEIRDYLNEQTRQVSQKYDYRYSILIMVFAGLIREGWLALSDLEGLSDDKKEYLQKILSL